MNALPGQLELATVIDHKSRLNTRPTHLGAIFDMPPEFAERMAQEDIHKPSGIRLAKMLAQYDDQPSSQLWGDIQRLAREILK